MANWMGGSAPAMAGQFDAAFELLQGLVQAQVARFELLYERFQFFQGFFKIR